MSAPRLPVTEALGGAAAPWSRRGPPWPTLTRVVLAGAVSVISLLLRQLVPVTPYGGRVDDLLYVRLGTFLAHGQWLGPFDQLTLAKDPGYPAFIALMYRAGLPLKVGEQLTYLLAAAAVAACVWVLTRRGTLALLAYLVLALDPVNFNMYDSQVIRDGWYASLSMLFVATLFLAIYAALTHIRLHWQISVSLLAGVSGASFWVSREEGPWILPTALLIALGLPLVALAQWWLAHPSTPLEWSRVLRKVGRLGSVLTIVGAVLVGVVAGVNQENSKHYGAPLISDIASGQFARVYADWSRVEAGTPSAETPLLRSQLLAVYQVSPASRQLEPYLEDPRNPWLRASCPFLQTCIELRGDLAIWALRDAAAKSGHFASESDAQSFFRELDTQILAACASRQLSCTPRLPAELQSLQRFAAGPFLNFLGRWTGKTILSSGFFEPPSPLKTLAYRWEPYSQIVRGLPPSQAEASAQLNLFIENIWPYRLLSFAYRVLLPCLLVLALMGLVSGVFHPRRLQNALSVLSAAFLVGALSRLLFVALVDTTQFPTAGSEIRFLLPAHAFFVAFGIVGTAQFADALRARRRRRSLSATNSCVSR